MSDDDFKDDKLEEDESVGVEGSESEKEEGIPDSDFASSNAAVAPSFDDAGDDTTTGDMHEDVFNAVPSVEDPHEEDYGGGKPPYGFNQGDEDGEDTYGEEEEDLDGYTEDSDSY